MVLVMVQDWSNASSICKAFSVGKNEATAVVNLQTRMPKEVLQALKVAICKRGMRNFITHELIVKGAFNDGFSSGQAGLEPWQQELTNGQDMLLVTYQQMNLIKSIPKLHTIDFEFGCILRPDWRLHSALAVCVFPG